MALGTRILFTMLYSGHCLCTGHITDIKNMADCLWIGEISKTYEQIISWKEPRVNYFLFLLKKYSIKKRNMMGN
jgi:hypothetical protein